MGMQYDEAVVYTSFPQGADLSAAANLYRFVVLGSNGQVTLGGANAVPLGFIGMVPEGSDTGRQVTLIYDAAKHFAVAQDAIAVGDLVKTGTQGRLAKGANPAGGGTNFIYGIALEAASANGTFLVQPIRSGVAG